jgi:hypothetical protein
MNALGTRQNKGFLLSTTSSFDIVSGNIGEEAVQIYQSQLLGDQRTQACSRNVVKKRIFPFLVATICYLLSKMLLEEKFEIPEWRGTM